MMCTNCGGTVELDAERMAKAKQMIAAGTRPGRAWAPVTTNRWLRNEEQMAAQRRRLAGTSASGSQLERCRSRFAHGWAAQPQLERTDADNDVDLTARRTRASEFEASLPRFS